MVDSYPGTPSQSADAPSGYFAAITPHDTTNLAYLTRGVYVGGGGVLQAVRDDGTVVAFLGVVAGSTLPIRVKRINATSTTCTGLVGLF